MVASRISERLHGCRPHGALMPYFTCGFPDVTTTGAFLQRADALGIPVVELGIPFSDSIADGPVIQSSFHAALAQGHRLQHALDLVRELRPQLECAVVAMLSYSLVYKYGLERFMKSAQESGIDGVILPDVPVEESNTCAQAAKSVGLSYVGLVAPTTSPARRQQTVEQSSGFVYQVASAGTTGERDSLAATLASDTTALRGMTSLPICTGFGISTPAHVRQVCAVADGAIVGSALVRRIQEGIDGGLTRDALGDMVQQALESLLAGTRSP